MLNLWLQKNKTLYMSIKYRCMLCQVISELWTTRRWTTIIARTSYKLQSKWWKSPWSLKCRRWPSKHLWKLAMGQLTKNLLLLSVLYGQWRFDMCIFHSSWILAIWGYFSSVIFYSTILLITWLGSYREACDSLQGVQKLKIMHKKKKSTCKGYM